MLLLLNGNCKRIQTYRLSVKLIRNAFKWFINSNYEQIAWSAHMDNIQSQKFAQKVGFTYGWKNIEANMFGYIATNPNKLIKFLYHKKLVSKIK